MPSWSMRVSASRPSRLASATMYFGSLAPSRKLNDEWACSSAYGTIGPSIGFTGVGSSFGRLCDAGYSPTSGPGAPGRPERRRSSSRQGIGSLFQPIPPLFEQTFDLSSVPVFRLSAGHAQAVRQRSVAVRDVVAAVNGAVGGGDPVVSVGVGHVGRQDVAGRVSRL